MVDKALGLGPPTIHFVIAITLEDHGIYVGMHLRVAAAVITTI